jgi:adenylate cyclase
MTGLLFIDDEEGVRRSVVRALRTEPYRVYTAKDGETGIRLIEEERSRISVVVSDYKMPGLDGLETLARIGTINPEITRILLTGYATMESAIRATNDGLDGFLTKPFDNIELRNKISEIVVGKRLRQFVSEKVYHEIKRDPTVMRPRKHKVTVLFSDIRRFTEMSQMVSPEELAAFLNEHYFTPMGEIAFRYDGTVDKHMGDCIMVVYGAPVSHEDDIIRAVESAIQMQEASKAISRTLEGKNGFRFRLGIGICTGQVLTGVFGSLRKREYTSFGMPVNVAARLEKLARGGEILVSETTYEEVSDRFQGERITPSLPVKGLKEPISIYRILGSRVSA